MDVKFRKKNPVKKNVTATIYQRICSDESVIDLVDDKQNVYNKYYIMFSLTCIDNNKSIVVVLKIIFPTSTLSCLYFKYCIIFFISKQNRSALFRCTYILTR